MTRRDPRLTPAELREATEMGLSGGEIQAISDLREVQALARARGECSCVYTQSGVRWPDRGCQEHGATAQRDMHIAVASIFDRASTLLDWPELLDLQK